MLVVIGWIALGVVAACVVFIPPALVGANYLYELGIWVSILAAACVITALVGFGVFAVTGNLG